MTDLLKDFPRFGDSNKTPKCLIVAFITQSCLYFQRVIYGGKCTFLIVLFVTFVDILNHPQWERNTNKVKCRFININ